MRKPMEISELSDVEAVVLAYQPPVVPTVRQ